MMGGLSFYKYLQAKHKKWILSITVHLTRKKFIYSGRYLKGAHFEEKIGQRGGLFKNSEGGSLKLIMSNLTYKLQTFTKHYIGHGNEKMTLLNSNNYHDNNDNGQNITKSNIKI